MAVDMFLKITSTKGDIKGESPDAKHKDEIEVLSWSWGASQSGSAHSASGAGSGKANVQDLTITKWVDKSSPVLYQHCLKGTHLKEAILTIRKAGDSPLEYVKVKLIDAIISSISAGGSGGQDRLTESVTINFAKMDLKYTPQKKDGSGDAEVPMTWNIAANTEDLNA